MDKIGILVICLFLATFSDAKPQNGRGFSVRKRGGDDDIETSTEILSESFENIDYLSEILENNDEQIIFPTTTTNIINQ